VPQRIASPYSQKLAAVLTSEYKKRGFRQEQLQAALGYTVSTLQRKLDGKSEINAEDVIRISRYIGADPTRMMEDAVELNGGLPALLPPVSEEGGIVTDFPDLNADDTGEIETYPGAKAAYRDAEADTDE
jgi:transcriptional regulator with XRE-family HTH domain